MKYTFYQYQKINNIYQLRENGEEVISVNNRSMLYNTVYYYKNIFVDKTTARKINGLIGAYTKKVNVLKRGEVLADKIIKHRR